MVSERIRRKAERAGWVLRYWLMDKYHEQLRLGAVALAALVFVGTLAAMYLSHVQQVAAGPAAPRGAFWWYIVVLVVAVLLAYALMPKPQVPEAQKQDMPVTKDGKSMVRIYGTVWIKDPAMLAWKNGAPEPIRKKGGK
jgi:hypothetical protein